ncbi:MAG: transcription termination factor NusA [Anaerolineales bacterium]|nr:transcription termination factor NusA [Anaerolineales bacterium]
MKNDFLVAITQLCNDRGLPKEVVIEAVEQSLVSAYKRNFGGGQNITAQIDAATGKVKIFAIKTVVDQVNDRRLEIALQDARAYDPMAQVGTTIQIESTPDDFGRIAAQAAKQVILQRIREAERDTLFTQFSERENEIVLGTVHNIDSQNITVSLGKLEAILPRAEQIPTERHRYNQKLRAYIIEVNKTARGPQVVLSRTHRNFLRRLFELEVPEIFNGLVEIKAISREPGSRSKVAVAAQQDGIDPVGACVGQRGVRIQAIVNELNGEKIDVVEWSSDVAKFIANSLSPAKAVAVQLAQDANGDKVANVVVEHKQLSLAIGKEGQNARLAAKLTGWRIDIKSEAQVAEQAAARAQAQVEQAAAQTAEQLAAAEAAKAALAEWEALVADEPVAPAAPTEETRAPVQAEPAPAETEIAPETIQPVVAEIVAEEPAPVVEAVAPEQPVEAAAPSEELPAPDATPPEPEITFEQALAEFEAEEEDISPEEKLKRKADRRKRTTLEFDEKLGKVVAKRKRKGGRQQDWVDEIE